MKKYEFYKDSGVEWLGDIPEHWNVKRIKYLFNEINERSEDGTEDLLSVSQYTGVTNKTEKVENGGMLTNALTLEGYKKVKKNDLVSNIMLAWNGSLGFSPFNGITSPAYSIYRLYGKNNNHYFHYLLRTELYKSEFKRHSSGVIESRLRLYTDDFFNIESIVPSLEEQTAIAEFLDDKTAKIDQAIVIKKQQIDLLKERRQILIHKAVTQGINPDVKLKDSGVEWIGEIPEGWEVKRLKYFINIQGGFAFNSSNFKNEGVQIIKIANTYMNELCLDRQPTFIEKSFLKTHNEWIVSKGDILMSLTGTLGKKDYGFAILIEDNEQYLLNQRVAKITMKKGFEPDYILDILRSEMYLNQLYMLPSGTKQANLSNDNVINIKVAFPSNQVERVTILEYVKITTTKIANAISLKEQEIERLKEYKVSLIDGVVTGKIKVS